MDASLDLQAIGFVGDVRKQDDAARVLDSTVKHFGRLDILVNAAAGNFLVAAEDLSPNGFKTGLFVITITKSLLESINLLLLPMMIININQELNESPDLHS